jgi:zinc/manganese transport system substrate-binding protein
VRAVAAGAALISMLAAAGCSTATGSSTGSSASPGAISVVAAENFYGDLTSQIGGDHVKVTSILTNPEADPHLYEPNSKIGLAVATADLVIANGAGYDAFVDRLVQAAPRSGRVVISIADVLGATGPDLNPHLWYDVPRLPEIVTAITNALIEADPAHRDDFRNGEQRVLDSLHPLQDAVATLERLHAGARVAATEPVADYLLRAAGLVDVTPPAFTDAIESGSEPSPQAVAATRALLTDRTVKVLIYNLQTEDKITQALKSLAQAQGIPVIGVTETMPTGTHLQAWQLDQIQELTRALGG